MAATRRVLKNYQSLRRHALNARPTIRHTHGSDSFQQRWMRSTSLLSNVSFSSTCDNHTSDNSPLKQRSLATFPLGNQYLQGQLSTPYRSQLTSTTRQISSVTEMLPEFAKQYSIWGGSGYILTALHDRNLPYWACISLTNVFVRSSLVPLVVKGAKTSAQLANVAPEVQFLVSSYTRDAKKLKDANAPPSQRLELLVAMWQSLRGIYKLHGVNPLDVLKSPLMQIPVFWYFSVDIRKLINGGDPELAQQLTESGILWVTDLTEPDPWYGLPILSGMFLYLNVEVAVGRQSLSGETASKSNIARYMKDGFQSEYDVNAYQGNA
jgi:membrane protein insertase Oxa1/YidC/SpoIIIJ